MKIKNKKILILRNELFSIKKQWFLDGPSPNDEPIKICSPYRKDQHPIAKGNKKPECLDKDKVFYGRRKNKNTPVYDYCCQANNPHNTDAANDPNTTPEYPWGKKGGGKTDKTDKYILLPVRESPILTKNLFEFWFENSTPIKNALELTKQDKKTNKLIKQKLDHYVKKTNIQIMDNIDIDKLADYDDAFMFYSNIKERSNLGNLTYTACKPVKAILSKDEKTAIGIQLESGISVPVKSSSFDSSMYKLPISNQHYYPGFNELQKDEIDDPRDSATSESIKFWKIYYDLCRKVADSKQRDPKTNTHQNLHTKNKIIVNNLEKSLGQHN